MRFDTRQQDQNNDRSRRTNDPGYGNTHQDVCHCACHAVVGVQQGIEQQHAYDVGQRTFVDNGFSVKFEQGCGGRDGHRAADHREWNRQQPRVVPSGIQAKASGGGYQAAGNRNAQDRHRASPENTPACFSGDVQL